MTVETLQMSRPVLVVIGPSASGKSTAVRELHRRGVLHVHPTWTTRARRTDETEGALEHRFVTDEVFDELEAAGFFLGTVALPGLPFRYALPQVARRDDGPVDTIMARAPFIDLFAPYFPNRIVYQIEDNAGAGAHAPHCAGERRARDRGAPRRARRRDRAGPCHRATRLHERRRARRVGRRDRRRRARRHVRRRTAAAGDPVTSPPPYRNPTVYALALIVLLVGAARFGLVNPGIAYLAVFVVVVTMSVIRGRQDRARRQTQLNEWYEQQAQENPPALHPSLVPPPHLARPPRNGWSTAATVLAGVIAAFGLLFLALFVLLVAAGPSLKLFPNK